MRTFAIININAGIDIHENIIRRIGQNDEIYVFKIGNDNNRDEYGVNTVEIPTEFTESQSKIKNYVTKYFFERGYTGYLHVIEDRVVIEKSPACFLDEIEKMMYNLHLNSWFNTVTDPCNYTFKMYNPRMSVCIDEQDMQKKYDKTIYFTSHANTSWICYDYNNSKFSDFEFDERFSIPMFYIIKFLAERRNNKKKGDMHYMNLYPTIIDERGVFKLTDSYKERTFNVDMQKEGMIFEQMNINNKADFNVEMIMEDIVNALKH